MVKVAPGDVRASRDGDVTDDVASVAPDRGRAVTARKGRGRAIAATVVAVIVALLLRAPFAEAYLPWGHHWDEITNVQIGERMAEDLSVDPGFYDYPALVFLTQAIVLVPAEHLGGYEPDEGGVVDKQTEGNAHVLQPGLLRAMRWTTGVLPSVATVAVAGWLAFLMTRRWWAAGASALLATISVVDVRYGTMVTPDALSGLGTALALVGAVKIAEQPTRRAYVLAGAALGLAVAAKYNAALVVLALALAHVLAHRRPLTEWRRLVPLAGAALVVFALLNPGAVLHPVRFVQELGSEGAHYGSGHLGNEGASPLFNAGWLWQSFGVGLVLAGCALLVRAPQARRAVVVVGGFALAYYLFVSAFPVRFARNLLPLTPAIAALAVTGVVALADRLAERWASPRHLRLAGAVGVALVVAVPVVEVGRALGSLSDDPWHEAQAWLAGNVPAGSTIAVESWGPYVDEDRYDVVPVGALGWRGLSFYREQEVDYVVAASERFDPYLDDPDRAPSVTAVYGFLLHPDCIVFEVEGAGRRILVAETGSC